jgi:hypothetical protein
VSDLLTEVVVIPALVTLSEQYRHTLRHIDPQKSIEVSDQSCEDSQRYSFCQPVIREVPTTEGGNLQVEFYDDSSI